MVAVFQNKKAIAVVDSDWVERVKHNASIEPLRRSRLNLHMSEDDPVQEMLIAFCEDTLNPPHRHLGKTESLHAVEGRALIVFFEEDGRVGQRISIGAEGTGLPQFYRLSAPYWHTVIPLDPMVVLHEVATGPFRREADIVPLWVPTKHEALRAFLHEVRIQLR